MSSKRLVCWLLLASGSIMLAVSIVFESSILAFIGLGLAFWGTLLLYIGTEEYVKQTLLDSSVVSSMANLDQILAELEYQGKGVYLPPYYFKGFETCKVFIAKNRDEKLPEPEEIQRQEDKIFVGNPKAVLVSPPGLSLSRLFEKTLGTSFTQVDLKYLQQNLPKLFIEDLEIARDLEMETEIDEASKKLAKIRVRMTDPVFEDVCEEAKKLSRIGGEIGCPICSAIACALTKATGKPVIIEKTEVREDAKTIEATFRLFETVESELEAEVLLEEVERFARRRLFSTIVSLLVTALGLTILVWVGWLTWFDTTTWGKDILHIFFGSRTGEAISLGIGMRVIHHFLIGLALLLSGLLTFLQRRRSRVEK